jgi:hypothetical protein
VGRLRLREDLVQVLLRLTDVLRDHLGGVHAVERQPQLGADHLRRQRLASARVAGEERHQPLAGGQLVGEAPGVEHLGAVAPGGDDLFDLRLLVGRQDEHVE